MSETYKDEVRKAIDQVFGERGLYIDWRLRNDVVDAIMAIRVPHPEPDDQGR